jgi:hypothetical protein
MRTVFFLLEHQALQRPEMTSFYSLISHYQNPGIYNTSLGVSYHLLLLVYFHNVHSSIVIVYSSVFLDSVTST